MRSGGYSDVGLYGGSALSATGKLGLALSARKFGIRPALGAAMSVLSPEETVPLASEI